MTCEHICQPSRWPVRITFFTFSASSLQQAAVLRIVEAVERERLRAVGLAHIGGAVEDAAIDADLQRADLHPVVAFAEPERQGV